jgi:hypothetical protein
MSLLLRLLTSGKSLVGLRDGVNRYRLSNRNRLPRFGSTHNPFQPPAEVSSVAEAVTIARAAQVDGKPAGEERRSQSRLPATPKPAVSPASVASGSGASAPNALIARSSPPAGRSRWLGSWFSPARRRATLPAATANKTPLQGELLLDRVQVVRNDLSDADLEVVAVRPSRRPVVPAPASSAKTLAGIPSRVGNAATRLLGTLKT